MAGRLPQSKHFGDRRVREPRKLHVIATGTTRKCAVSGVHADKGESSPHATVPRSRARKEGYRVPNSGAGSERQEGETVSCGATTRSARGKREERLPKTLDAESATEGGYRAAGKRHGHRVTEAGPALGDKEHRIVKVNGQSEEKFNILINGQN